MPGPHDPLTPPATVGFIGVGRMGHPMTARLVDAGYTVRCYDSDPQARGRAAERGAVPVSAPAEVLTGAAAVLLSLPTSDAVEEVLLAGGLADAVPPGTVVADLGSSRPSSTRRLGRRFAARQAGYLDAPVSGGVVGAETGGLTIMAGGPGWALHRLRPVLGTLGSQVLHVGDTGAGHALKALNNLLSATHLLATSEAMRIGEAFGLDPETMLAAFNTSSGRSGSTDLKWPKYVLPGTFDAGFTARLMVKDMRIAMELAADTGRPAPLGEAAVRLWDEAARSLPEGADHTEIVRWLDQAAGQSPSESDGHPV